MMVEDALFGALFRGALRGEGRFSVGFLPFRFALAFRRARTFAVAFRTLNGDPGTSQPAGTGPGAPGSRLASAPIWLAERAEA